MTHDELLDIIGHWNWVEPEPLLKALRAVVELHKQVVAACGDVDCCGYECDSCAENYPCKTIMAIEKELK